MRQLLILSLFALLGAYAAACDVCGASNSIAGFGSYANGNRTNIGLNYQFKTYHSHHPPLFNEPGINSRELFQRFDLKGQIRLSPRFQLQFDLPFTVNQQVKDGQKETVSGPGDFYAGIHYFIVNRRNETKKQTIRWNMGAGIKSPTGKFTHPDSSDLMLYSGTGSWDIYASNLLYFQANKWTFVWETTAFFRNANKYQYQAGNSVASTLLVNRNLGKWSVFTGIQGTYVGNDFQNRSLVDGSPTTGSIVTNMWGVTWQFSDFMVQGAYHIPLYQHLGNGYTQQKQAFALSLYYFLP